MPMSVKCPECDASYKVPDEAAGKAIRCKKCGAKVPVPAADDEDDDDFSNLGDKGDGDAKEKKKGSKTLLIVGIVAAVLTCCLCLPGGGGFGAYLFVIKPAAEAAKKLADEAAKKLADAEKERKKLDKDEGGATIFAKNDTLTLKDQRVADGRPAKTYKVKLEGGKGYIIDMKASSKEFGHDPYLILLDPQNKVVARDDDSGGGLDAQIRHTPPATGEYTVQATCFIGVPPQRTAVLADRQTSQIDDNSVTRRYCTTGEQAISRPRENAMTRTWTLLLINCCFTLLGAGEPAKPFQQTPDEVKLVELTNQERKKMDLPLLKLSPALSKIARGHSENMARQAKMEHILDNKGPFDRLRDAGYKYMKAGENIASGQGVTLATIMKAWMDSKEHRANILLAEYTEIGLGIARDKTGQLYFTQVFAKPRTK